MGRTTNPQNKQSNSAEFGVLFERRVIAQFAEVATASLICLAGSPSCCEMVCQVNKRANYNFAVTNLFGYDATVIAKVTH
jgi:hypothetical protein